MTCVDCDLARAVAAYGLRGTLSTLPDEPLNKNTWNALFDRIKRQRLTGLLLLAITESALPVKDAQAEAAAAAHKEVMAGALRLERALLDIVNVLESDGIGTRVLKGPASAHLDYPDPALRDFGDIDLLVRGPDIRRTIEILTKAGYRRRYPEVRPGFDARFGKGPSFDGPDGLQIDVHRTLAFGPAGLRIQVADLWVPGTPLRIGGRELVALPPELRLLHACYHAALGSRVSRLVPLRDIAQLLLGGSVDQTVARTIADRWCGQSVVAHAVTRAWAALQISDVLAFSAWAEHYQPSAAEERDLRCYHDQNASYAHKAVAGLRALPRLRDRLAYGTAMAIPRREYRLAVGERVLPRLRRGMRLLIASGSDRR